MFEKIFLILAFAFMLFIGFMVREYMNLQKEKLELETKAFIQSQDEANFNKLMMLGEIEQLKNMYFEHNWSISR